MSRLQTYLFIIHIWDILNRNPFARSIVILMQGSQDMDGTLSQSTLAQKGSRAILPMMWLELAKIFVPLDNHEEGKRLETWCSINWTTEPFLWNGQKSYE